MLIKTKSVFLFQMVLLVSPPIVSQIIYQAKFNILNCYKMIVIINLKLNVV